MIKFAELDNNNKVINVVISTDAGISAIPGIFIKVDLVNSPNRGDAHIGGSYDKDADKFIAPKPWPSWILNENTLEWDSPVAKPSDEKIYMWDENNMSWIELEEVEIPLPGQNPVQE